MYWQDDKEAEVFKVSDEVFDLLFEIQCKELPVDHAYELAAEIMEICPWIQEDSRIGIHNIHVAGAQNGWERPDPEQGQRLVLSKRTKLSIRTPKEFADKLKSTLRDSSLTIEDCTLTIGKAKSKLLSKQDTIFCRQIVLEGDEATDEMAFMQRVSKDLAERGIRMKKALPGKTTYIKTPDGPIATRSLMLASLSPEESVKLQQEGVGPLRHLGCGIFIPHKGIEAVKKQEDD